MAEAQNRHNKRILPRHNLKAAVDVYDSVSQALLGRVVNVSSEGVMIMGNHPFSESKIYQLDLHLPTPINEHNSISVGVDCLWTRTEEENMFWAGCKIIDIADSARIDLENLIQILQE
ncbi:hypothetical protein NBRC116493_07220 [Aurantivibrio infirmus]